MAVGDLGIKKIVVCTVSTIVGALLIASLATLYKTGGEKIFPGIYWNMKEETAERIQKEAEGRFDDADKMLREAVAKIKNINDRLETLNRQVVEAGDDLDKKIESQHDLQSQRAQADTEYAGIKKLHDKAKKELEQANEQWRKVREKNKSRSTVEVTDEYDDEEVVIISDDTTEGGDAEGTTTTTTGQPATEEEPKVEEPKVEEPKVEEPKVEEPKVEEPKVEEPKVEEPKVEEPKVEEPKVEEPKVEEPKVEEPKVEEPKVEEPKVEEPKVEEPKVEDAQSAADTTTTITEQK